MKVNQPGDPCNNQQEGIKKLLDELEDGIDLTLDQKDDSEYKHDASVFPFVSTSLEPEAIKNREDRG